jgi:hypothetical protein
MLKAEARTEHFMSAYPPCPRVPHRLHLPSGLLNLPLIESLRCNPQYEGVIEYALTPTLHFHEPLFGPFLRNSHAAADDR